ncbi:MAG: hypothetical protein IMZ50_08815 [Candidatus Atribacteria bacterium]|nr:hypothetical protein [Candidatus Atribacteria bacterium]
MPSPAVDITTGTTITFATSAFTAEIASVNGPDYSRESINTSHLGTTTAHTFIPADLYDAGSLSLSIHYNPDTTVPINSAPETITVTYPAGATVSFSGFMTGHNATGPLEDKMTADVTIKITGAVTRTADGAGTGS